ncbi:unnamed protein product, partial [marine sediment metagenome]
TEEAHEIENFIEKQCKELGLKNVKKEVLKSLIGLQLIGN